jgi:diguanylate cyclase (GGDEF)-like protein/PAS domain S-box-containing protein
VLGAFLGSWLLWPALAAVVAVYAVLTTVHSGNSPLWIDVSDSGEVAAAALAALACVLRARMESRRRQAEGPHRSSPGAAGSQDDAAPQRRRVVAWQLLGIGMALWAVGEVITCVYEIGLDTHVPEPSAADLAFLLGYAVIIAGLLAFIRTPAGRLSQLRTVVEGLFMASGFLLCSWSLVIGSVLDKSGSLDFSGLVNFSYPVLDAISLAGVFFAMLRNRLQPPAGLALLAAGIALLAVADSSWWYLTEVDPSAPSVSPIQTGWVAGFLLIAVAAARVPRRRLRTRRAVDSKLVLMVPALPAIGGILMVLSSLLSKGHLDSENALIGIMGADVLLGLALLVIVIYENHALTTDLENRVHERTAALDRTERYYRALVQHSSDLVLVVGADLTIRYASDSAQTLFGFAPAELLGRGLEVFGRPAEESIVEALALAHPEQEHIAPVQWRLIDSSGRLRSAESTVTNLLADPAVGGFVLNTRDDTDRVALADQLREQAFHDDLTGLPNRALLSDRAVQAFARSLRGGGAVALMVLDLDAFKLINDGFGHRTGDLLLRAVAERLRAEVRPGDTVARLGGDEFVVLMDPAPAPEDAMALGRRIAQALEGEIEIEGNSHRVTVSVGIAIDTVPNTDFDQLLCDADVALYTVKGSGKNAVQLFEPSMNMHARERFRLQADLRRALDNGELCLFYQPECEAKTGRLDGFEALIRWRHPEHGLMAPDRFIPLAEETGLIVPIGRWVLFEALTQAAAWSAAHPHQRPLKISVNVSAVQLRAPGLLDDVREALLESEIDPGRVVLEVTESSFIESSAETLATLRALKDLGVRLAIDDFGTGYASISNLRNMPVDILKVDKSFVSSGEHDAATAAELLEAIVNIGQVLSLVTVAEGVEETEQLDTVRDLGCDLAQGYLLGRPLPPQDAAHLIAEHAGAGRPHVPAVR